MLSSFLHPMKEQASESKSVTRERWALLLLFVWAIPCVVVGATLMVGHWVPLPVPDRSDPVLRDALAHVAAPKQSTWRLVHVLYAQCRCSERTFDYLFERGKAPAADETVVLVGKHPEYERRAREAGFSVEQISRRELKERFNVESAPLLLVVDPAGQIRYSGGYTARKQGLDYQDLAILSRLQGGAEAKTIPAYGCGVSKELQSYLDPIGVKYGGNEKD